MSLMDEIRSELRSPGVRCQVVTVLASLDEDVRVDLTAAIADVDVSAAAIERALKRRGVTLKAPNIQRHRRGDCTTCGRQQ